MTTREKLFKYILERYSVNEDEILSISPWMFQYHWRAKLNNRSLQEEIDFQAQDKYPAYGVELDEIDFYVAVESLFDICIKDEEAEIISTFDELIDLIDKKNDSTFQ